MGNGWDTVGLSNLRFAIGDFRLIRNQGRTAGFRSRSGAFMDAMVWQRVGVHYFGLCGAPHRGFYSVLFDFIRFGMVGMIYAAGAVQWPLAISFTFESDSARSSEHWDRKIRTVDGGKVVSG